MTEGPGSKDVSGLFKNEMAAEWMEEHMPELRQSYLGQHFLYMSFVTTFVVGLAAHIGGYMLMSSAPSGPLGLLADLLHAFGWSLWTGVVVVLFTEVIPEAKRRQIRQVIDAYEAWRNEKTQAGDDSIESRPG